MSKLSIKEILSGKKSNLSSMLATISAQKATLMTEPERKIAMEKISDAMLIDIDCTYVERETLRQAANDCFKLIIGKITHQIDINTPSVRVELNWANYREMHFSPFMDALQNIVETHFAPGKGADIVPIPTRFNLKSTFFESTKFTAAEIHRFAVLNSDMQRANIDEMTQDLVILNKMSADEADVFKDALREEFITQSQRMSLELMSGPSGNIAAKLAAADSLFDARYADTLSTFAASLLAKRNRDRAGDRTIDIVFQGLRNV